MAEPQAPQPGLRPITSSVDTSAESQAQGAIHEVAALFIDAHDLEVAVQDLLTHGFDHGDVALLAGEHTVRQRLGHRIADSRAAADDPATPRRGWIEPESRTQWQSAIAAMLGYVGAVTAVGLTFATGGAAAAAIGAALVGAGGGAGLGAGLARVFDQRLAHELERQITAGGILLWVRCRETAGENRAREILARHGAQHVHAHTIG